jgi:hypothetical protein
VKSLLSLVLQVLTQLCRQALTPKIPFPGQFSFSEQRRVRVPEVSLKIVGAFRPEDCFAEESAGVQRPLDPCEGDAASRVVAPISPTASLGASAEREVCAARR